MPCHCRFISREPFLGHLENICTPWQTSVWCLRLFSLRFTIWTSKQPELFVGMLYKCRVVTYYYLHLFVSGRQRLEFCPSCIKDRCHTKISTQCHKICINLVVKKAKYKISTLKTITSFWSFHPIFTCASSGFVPILIIREMQPIWHKVKTN